MILAESLPALLYGCYTAVLSPQFRHRMLPGRVIPLTIAGVLSLLLGASAARGSIIVYRTDAELVAMSDRVVYGRVVDLRPEADGTGAVYTVVTLAIIEDLTGIAGEQIEVRELGGEVGDMGVFVGGAARFELGRDVVVCLDEFAPGRYRTVSLSFSKFDVEGDGDEAVLTRSIEALVIAGSGIAALEPARTLGSFRSIVGAIKNAEPFRPAVPPVAVHIQPFTFLAAPPIRWHVADAGLPIVWYQNSDHPAPLADGSPGTGEIQTALRAWTDPASASIVLQYGGTRPLGGASPICPISGAGVVTFEDPLDQIGPNILALGGGCYNPQDTRRVNGMLFYGFTAAYVVLQNAVQLPANFRQSRDFGRVLEHEIGHGIGLGHTDAAALPSPQANIMFGSCCSSSTPLPPAIGPDDHEGLAFIYPAGATSACTYAVAPTTASFGATAATGSVTVTTQGGCPWAASSTASFVVITSGSSGTGAGTVTFVVSANTLGTSRTGTLSIAGITVTINQSGGDTDSDGLPDDWESFFGFSSSSGSGSDGASGDPDGDGRTNLQEYQAGSHPRNVASLTRYFAEGATSSFFDTRIALANPGTADAAVLLRFLKSDGTTATERVAVPALARRTVIVKDLAGLAEAEFSTIVETDRLVVADRTMKWNAVGYGSHTEGAVLSPASTWYLAEGATHSGFSLFYLLQNPNSITALATVTYLRPAPLPPISHIYNVPPNSRWTISVDSEDPGLASTDVSAIVQTSSSTPIIVERAMYLDAGNERFGAGHSSAGLTALSRSWFFAEGATGPFFDLFLLLANPGSARVTVNATYLLPGGATVSRAYVLEPNSRRTIAVDSEAPELANTAVSASLTASDGIVAERSMWWPGTPATWHEAHNSPGAPLTGIRWAMAEGQQDRETGMSSYVLVANTGGAATVRVTLLMEDGSPNVTRDFVVGANSRFNVDIGAFFPEAAGRRFGAIVESMTGSPIVVERATYSDAAGVTWAAGGNALATRLQ